jgi:hypothetical protein
MSISSEKESFEYEVESRERKSIRVKVPKLINGMTHSV